METDSTIIFNKDANGNATNGSLKLTEGTPSFVSWNWPLIRKCTFFTVMSSLLAMFILVIAMIITMPKSCNPKTAWYRGSVFYEVFPASFQDSNNDGVGDLLGIRNRVDYFGSLGISAVRLNSIFSTASHYPEDYENVTSLFEISNKLGTTKDLQKLSESLHERNISLILDLPIGSTVKELGHENKKIEIELNTTSAQTAAPLSQIGESLVSQALRKWIEHGVDGFYIKGLEYFATDKDIVKNLAAWKQIIGSDGVIIVSEVFINELPSSEKANALSYIDLVDVYLDVSNNTRHLEEKIRAILAGPLSPIDANTWIHWNIGGIDHERVTTNTKHTNFTLAASLMQLMLPGTPSLFYGDEISLQAVSDPHNEHNDTSHLHHLTIMKFPKTALQFTNPQTLPWLPQAASANLDQIELITDMIKLRDRSPSIYKNSICRPEKNLPNTQILSNHDDIILVERIYPRRNSFVSVSNFGPKRVSMDLTSKYYSGKKMLDIYDNNEKIYFANFEIGPFQTILVKLDK